MRKVVRFLWRLVKWLLLSIILLLILVAIVVKVPAVHDYILSKATTYFNDKTGGNLRIQEIDLRIPTYVQLGGISMKTPENENLAHIGNVEISIGWRYLFDKTIRIDKFVLEDVNAQLLNLDGNSWNYDFIINGFADSTSVDTSKAKSEWDFSLGYARLDDVSMTYFDATSNDSISANLSDFTVAMNRVSVMNNAYIAEKIALSNSDAFVRIGVRKKPPENLDASANEDSLKSPEMVLDVHEVLLENNTINYEMGEAPDKFLFDIGYLNLLVDKLDINEQIYRLNKIDFRNSVIEMAVGAAAPDTNATIEPINPFAPIDLKLDKLNVDKVAFKMRTIGDAEATLNLSKIHVELANLLANKDEYSGELKSLRGVYDQLDGLQDFHTNFAFTREKIALESLFVQYGASEINANIRVDYYALSDLIDNGKFEKAFIDISNTNLEPADLENIGKGLGVADSVLIVPSNTIYIEALANGNLKNLNLQKFNVKIGNTILNVKADAFGAGAWDNKDYTVNALNLHLERHDIMNYITAFDLDTAMVPQVADLSMEGIFATLKTQLKAELRSTYGNINITGKAGGYKSKSMPIEAEIHSRKLNLGGFLGLDVPFVTDFHITANAEDALDSSIYADASILIDTLAYDSYTLRNIDLNASLDSNLFSYQMLIDDTFLVLNLGGSGALSPDFKANIAGEITGIDLQGLGVTKDDLRGQLQLKAEYGQTEKFQNGRATILNAIFVRDEERYELEPIIAEAYLNNDSSTINVESQFFDLYSITNRSIEDLTIALTDLLGRGENTLEDTTAYWRVNFESYDTPLLRNLFVPELKSFDPATATIDFDASKPAINADINFPKIKYQEYFVDSLRIIAKGDKSNIGANLTIQHVGLDTLGLDRVHVKSATTQEGAEIILMINESQEKDSTKADYYAKMDLIADSISLRQGYTINITDSLVLNKKRWMVDEENDIHSSKEGIKLSKLRIYRKESELEINKAEEENSTRITASDFSLAAIAGMINTTQDLLTGRLFGDFTLNSDGTFSGNGRIEKFTVAQADFGLFEWNANKASESFNVELSSAGKALDFNATGTLTPQGENESSIDMQFNLARFDLGALPNIVPTAVYEGNGTISGKIDIDGKTSAPQLNGSLGFDKGELGLVANGSTYRIDNQKIDIKPEEIFLSKFSILDSAGQKLVIDGNITHQNFDNLQSNLTIKANNFEIANLKAEANQGYYGRLLADLDIAISGRLDAPKIRADIDIDDKTALTYVVPESEYSDSYDDNMLVWTEFDSKQETDILTRSKQKRAVNRDVYANTIDLNGEININERAIFRVLIDSLAGDYLEIQGGGKLGIMYDRTGNLSLNGTYKVRDGFYQMSFYNVVKKKFDFQGGSQLTWNGDPMNANLDITALYKTRANVAALMSAQAGASNNAFSQKLPFEVVMNITGELLQPVLKFDIRLAKEAKGALGGAVDARLNEIASNESELNKQVFALLVLNTFISTAGTGGDGNMVENQVRNSASQILSQQLNALSDRLINGVDLNFDLQSYDGGNGQANTDLNIDLAKSFLDDRLVIRVGSTIALEDNNQNSQNSQEMMTNIAIEYKITPEGTYRLKAYRTTDLEDIVVGRITRTGAGVLYQKDFNRIENIFKVKSDLGNEGKSEDQETDVDPNPADGK